MLKKRKAICKSGGEVAIFTRIVYSYKGLYECSILCKRCVFERDRYIIGCQGLEYAMCRYVNRNEAYLSNTNFSYVI